MLPDVCFRIIVPKAKMIYELKRIELEYPLRENVEKNDEKVILMTPRFVSLMYKM